MVRLATVPGWADAPQDRRKFDRNAVELTRYADIEARFKGEAQWLVDRFTAGEIDERTLVRGFDKALEQAELDAFVAGRRASGTAAREVSPSEGGMLARRHGRQMDFFRGFVGDMKAGRGRMDYSRRAGLYADSLWSVYSRGESVDWDEAGSANSRWHWVLDPDAEHCFPAGTLVSTPNGSVPIEALRVGDLVRTRFGARRVVTLFCSPFYGELVKLNAGGKTIRCTPNHPFLTIRGWSRAGDVTPSDQVALLQDGSDVRFVRVSIPKPNDIESQGSQSCVPSGVVPPLSRLSLGEWLESRMAVPVLAVNLKDQSVAHKCVYDEARWNEEEGREPNADLAEGRVQPGLKRTRALRLSLAAALGKGLKRLIAQLWPLVPPCSHFGPGCFVPHRVGDNHVSPRGVVNDSVLCFDRQRQAKFSSEGKHLGSGLFEERGTLVGAASSVVVAQPGDLGFGPLSPGSLDRHATRTRGAFPDSHVSAHRAGFHHLPSFAPAVGGVATRDATESRTPRWTSRGLEGPPAQLALHRGTVKHLHSVPIAVYNIEVEGVHEYIADGFVVHNCRDCLKRAGLSRERGGFTWDELVELGWPGENTICRTSCRCSVHQERKRALLPERMEALRPAPTPERGIEEFVQLLGGPSLPVAIPVAGISMATVAPTVLETVAPQAARLLPVLPLALTKPEAVLTPAPGLRRYLGLGLDALLGRDENNGRWFVLAIALDRLSKEAA